MAERVEESDISPEMALRVLEPFRTEDPIKRRRAMADALKAYIAEQRS